MKDLIGQEVSVGDKVLHVSAYRGYCTQATVAGFTATRVRTEEGDLYTSKRLVVITKQLSKQPLLTEDDAENLEFLEALNAAGVDNWQGIDEAHEIVREWRKERGEAEE